MASIPLHIKGLGFLEQICGDHRNNYIRHPGND